MIKRLPNIALDVDVHQNLKIYCRGKMLIMHQLVNNVLRRYMSKPEIKKFIEDRK